MCPTRDELAAYLLGDLPPDANQAVAEHIEDCSHCQSTLASLSGVHDTLVSALRKRNASQRYTDEPDFHKAVSQVATLMPGEPAEQNLGKIGPYRLLEKIGEGGMGAVYKALHTRLKRVVAIKVLPAERVKDARAVARFEREMEAIGRLDHHNIVRASDADEHEGQHYLVMDYVDGENLSSLVKRRGALPIADACELMRQAAEGLQYAHEHGLVHRDIKPSNLMLAWGNSERGRGKSERGTGKSERGTGKSERKEAASPSSAFRVPRWSKSSTSASLSCSKPKPTAASSPAPAR